MDEESGLVRQAEMTSADLHDSQRGEAMIQGDEAAYYADKAYDSQALRDKLGELGIEDRIAYKAKRNKPLVNWQVWFNKTASRIRVGVERASCSSPSRRTEGGSCCDPSRDSEPSPSHTSSSSSRSHASEI